MPLSRTSSTTKTSPAEVQWLGSRNRAILLLLARLGLRAGDVVRLRFSDVDWKEGVTRVSGKGRRETVLPLSQEVGDALAGYIKDHRPQADTDAVFVRSCAPYRAFTDSTSISIIVARAMRRVGINCSKPARSAPKPAIPQVVEKVGVPRGFEPVLPPKEICRFVSS
jgi:integrase